MATITFGIQVYDGARSTPTNLIGLEDATVTHTQLYNQGGYPAGTTHTQTTNVNGYAVFTIPDGNIIYATTISKTGYITQTFEAVSYGEGGGLIVGLTPVPLAVAVTPATAQIRAGQSVTLTAHPVGGAPPYTVYWYDEATGARIGSGNTLAYLGSAVGSYGVTAQVTDSMGNVADSAVIPITVSNISPPTDTGKLALIALGGVAAVVILKEAGEKK
jgi:hypothetical protein